IAGGYLQEGNGGALLNNGDLTLDRVVISGSVATSTSPSSGNGFGGGIYNGSTSSRLTILSSEIDANMALFGGGIATRAYDTQSVSIERSTIAHNNTTANGNGAGLHVLGAANGASNTEGTIRVRHSTISNNTSANGAGGVYVSRASNLVLEHITIAENTGSYRAGGIEVLAYNSDTTSTAVELANSIVARNSSTSTSVVDDIRSDTNTLIVTSSKVGGSFSGISLTAEQDTENEAIMLSPLGRHGGATSTHALRWGSNAIRNGALVTNAGTDQRGFFRDGLPDVGAFEFIRAPENGGTLDDDPVPGDYDGDGYADLLYYDVSGRQVLVEPGSSSTGQHVWAVGIDGLTTPRVGDFNGDGRDDLAFYEPQSARWHIALSDTNRFTIHETLGTKEQLGADSFSNSTTVAGDFDGDGADELLGRRSFSNPDQWWLLDVAGDGTPLVAQQAGYSIGFDAAVFVGDANRDGYDDLIASTNPTQSNDSSGSNPNWFVSYSNSNVQLSGTTKNLGDWFDGAYSTSTNTLDADRSYRRVVELYESVYDNIEMQFYRGFMKGPQAARETGRANSWDQAALLVDDLRASGFDADIVTGKISLPQSDLAEWVGTKTTDAAKAILHASQIGIDYPVGNVRFDHAWVRVQVPTQSGFGWIHLDPSWKTKARQPGIAADLNPGEAFGTFDELKYIEESDGRLPIEFYEDQVADFLAANGLNASLADVPYDGPIIPKATLDAALETDGHLATAAAGTHTVLGDLFAVVTDAEYWKAYTHRIRVGNGLIYATPYAPFVALSIVVSGSTATFYEDEEKIGVTQISGGSIEIAVAAPGEPIGSESRKSQITIDTSIPEGKTYLLSFSADQSSAASLERRREDLNLAYAQGSPSGDVSDIPEVLAYVNEKYWHDANRYSRQSAQLLHTIPLNGVQYGVASADNFLLTGDLSFLQTPIVPRSLSVDLPGGGSGGIAIDYEVSMPQSADPGKEYFQLAGYTKSALEHAVIEEIANTESMSTIKGLVSAYAGDPGITGAPTNSVWVLQSVVEATGRKLYVRGELGERAAEGPSNIPYLPNRVNHVVGSAAELQSYFPSSGHPTATIQKLWDRLMTGLSGNTTATVLVPEQLSYAGDDSSYWEGSVYLAQRPERNQYAIQAVGGAVLDGGFSSNSRRPRNQNINRANTVHNNFAGDPVNVLNGNMFRDETDIVMPNIGVPLTLSRHYDAQSDFDIGLGVGWLHSFADRLLRSDETPEAGVSEELIWLTSDGVRHTFQKKDGSWHTPVELFGEFEQITGGYIFRDDQGIEHHFDSVTAIAADDDHDYIARLKQIIDRNQNGVSLSYTTVNSFVLTKVEDVHTNERRLDFTHAGTHIDQIEKVVNDSVVGSWDYAFSGPVADRLTSVTNPLDEVVRYDYYATGFGQGLISRITEPDNTYHDYEYYPNDRVFRVREGLIENGLPVEKSSHSFSYNLFTNTTEFIDERGHTTTYVHQENGRLLRHIHDDRSRIVTTWGAQDGTEYLMTSRIDENGAV
ncbi:MAG: DUF6531 domain-containing protein, partial [Planctomycetota bacterium]